jgi:NADH-ubiquinone oxidoreductase chain 5
VIGTLTILIARVSALFEIDLKKIVALSTLSQLGVMILRLGLGAFLARFFHLLTHAFFKALLFLATGGIIHRSNRYQDLRTIGRARKIMPLTRGFVLVSLFRLMGLPFISAFFSKELILEIILIKNFNLFIYLYIALGVALTALYRARFVYMGIVNFSKNEQAIFKSDEDNSLITRMLILLFPAILTGAFLSLALFPSISLRSRPFTLKVGIISLVFFSLLLRIYLNIKLKISS